MTEGERKTLKINQSHTEGFLVKSQILTDQEIPRIPENADLSKMAEMQAEMQQKRSNLLGKIKSVFEGRGRALRGTITPDFEWQQSATEVAEEFADISKNSLDQQDLAYIDTVAQEIRQATISNVLGFLYNRPAEDEKTLRTTESRSPVYLKSIERSLKSMETFFFYLDILDQIQPSLLAILDQVPPQEKALLVQSRQKPRAENSAVYDDRPPFIVSTITGNVLEKIYGMAQNWQSVLYEYSDLKDRQQFLTSFLDQNPDYPLAAEMQAAIERISDVIPPDFNMLETYGKALAVLRKIGFNIDRVD